VAVDVGDRISALDTTLFEHVEVQLDAEDRRSLLALHAGCREAFGTFSYLEIGSHLGGSLQVFVRDPACRTIVSLDPRPESQPDERGFRYRYPDNTTGRMLEALATIPGADPGKVRPIERGTGEVDPGEIGSPPELAFVDGEHTDRAVLRDARFCDAAMRGTGCIAFHDAAVVYRGVGRFLSELESADRPFYAYLLPDSIFVVELGDARLLGTEPVATRAREGYKAYLHGLEETEPYRAEYRRLAHRVLRRLERLVADTARVFRRGRASSLR
jgi:hypothetical protein